MYGLDFIKRWQTVKKKLLWLNLDFSFPTVHIWAWKESDFEFFQIIIIDAFKDIIFSIELKPELKEMN